MPRVRLAGILPMKDGFAFMHRKGVKNHPIGDYYTFPGGGMEDGETFEEGVKREIKEEFGIEVDVLNLLYEKHADAERNKDEYFYLCKYVGGQFGTGDGPEFNNDPAYADRGEYIPEIISKDDLEKIILLPGDIRDKFINDLKNGKI